MNQEGGHLAAGIDLSQFYQVFFEEAGENLEAMEQRLLALDLEGADDEALNAIFRCAHSVKGGAATFGFGDVAALTHEMETLLDRLRRHELAPAPEMVDLLLAAGDALRAQLARHQGLVAEAPDTEALQASIRVLASGAASASSGVSGGSGDTAAALRGGAACEANMPAAGPAPGAAARRLELTVGPLPDPAVADQIAELFAEIPGLGSIEPLDGGQAAEGMRRFAVHTDSGDDELLDLLGFHVAREQVRLAPLGTGYGFHAGAPGAPACDPARDGAACDIGATAPTSAAPPRGIGAAATDPARAVAAVGAMAADPPTPRSPTVDPGWGLFDDAPGAPPAPPAIAPATAAGAAPRTTDRSTTRPEARPAAGAESGTLRVSVEKVDQLLNLVGELVITQAMLAQTAKAADTAVHPPLAAGLADLERNTRELQEAVMSIRMIPMSLVFNRFPRMLRDLAGKLGKKVELVTQGEATELDKGLVEKITDPLTHLVRNSCDHGIETPEERVARGKPAHGTVTLVASHQGGSVVIEVRDDGRGLNRARLLAKARERGIDAPDTLTDAEVWQLIFAPGFSTADAVTDVSGRGVGMDVVKRNIAALNGTVEIDSAEGCGMCVRVRLPLTLAIMDGMSVAVGDEVYIVPLAAVLESFQVGTDTVRTIGGRGRVVRVREEMLPVVDLEQLLQVPRTSAAPDERIMVLVEAEDARAALLVDELVGQQQVVVKNLEANYHRVPDVSGATILGDGRVALILDAGSLVRRARR